MQKLIFHPAWDKSLSVKDRNEIQEIFDSVKEDAEHKLYFSRLWEAINHHGELLISVIIHNTDSTVFNFEEQFIHYYKNDKLVASHTFSLPIVRMEPHTSMPWTFIFPSGSFHSSRGVEGGKLGFG